MGGGCRNIRYALIGLAAYSFLFDLSKSTNLQFLMFHYLIAFNDLHNYHVPVDVYRKFLREEYLASRLPLEPFDLNNPFGAKKPLHFSTPQKRLAIRRIADRWTETNYPDTRAENIKILDDYLSLCEDNNIRPIMFLPPMTEGYMKHFNKCKLDEFYHLVGQACRKHPSTVFIDGWKLQGLTDADFYDYGHFNLMGAAKFSIFLNGIIEQLDGGR